MQRLKTFIVLGVCGGLTGCMGPKVQPLYQWGPYQDSLYNSYVNLEETGLSVQAAEIGEYVRSVESSGEKVPPGIHAHLGYLLLQQGKQDEALNEFEIEKKLFPEATVFIDGLIERMAR